MKMLTMVVPLLLAAAVAAQSGPDTLWTRTYGWTGADTAFSVQRTFNGGFVIAGNATWPQDPHFRTCMFLMRTDSLGVMQVWRTYGNDPGYEYGAYSVVQTADSGYFVAGYASPDSGLYDELGQSYGLRLSAWGDSLWEYVPFTTLPPGPGFASAVALLADGRLVIAFWEGPFINPESRLGLNMITPNGTLQWTRWISHPVLLVSHGLRVLSDGGFAIAGTEDSPSPSRAFFAHLSATGQVIDTNFFGGDSMRWDEAWDVVETPDGFLLAGFSAADDGGLLLCKTDTAGEPLWIRRHHDDHLWREARAMLPALGGEYVIAGAARTQSGETDMYLAKINGLGDILWERTYGAAGVEECAMDVIQTPDSGFVLVGSISHPFSYPDWYIVKTAPDPLPLAMETSWPYPAAFTLSASPNPFNSATRITFDVPQSRRVRLAVFDLLGREVALLLDEMRTAGTHTVRFDGRTLPSGIYLVRLTAGGVAATQKLMLLK